MHRSYLFAPGHNAKLLRKAFETEADAVILDMEDAVPPAAKADARAMVAETLATHPAWVRVNAPRSEQCAADLDAVSEAAVGIRVPKVESAEDVQWVADRVDGKPFMCAIETARGVLAALEIASVPAVQYMAIGGVDLQRDLNTGDGNLYTLHARSQLVLACRAAGLEPPIDSVYPHIHDDEGLKAQAEFARDLGFGGKSVIHPRQIPIVHSVFTPSSDKLAWARSVVAAFHESGGDAIKLPTGEFVDLPVAERARRILQSASAIR